jgi:hypothetical protein
MKKIVIVQSGWVFVGDVVVENSHVKITDAQNIRVWGTTQGLGELALTGPTSETVLDDYGVVTVPVHAVLAYINCKYDWSNHK